MMSCLGEVVATLRQNIEVPLYIGGEETSPKNTYYSHDFKGRSETNQDVTSHNVRLHHVLSG